MKIPFSPPYIDASVIDEVTDSLRSGWITTGPKVKALEQIIQTYCDVPEVLCVNSWTSGAIMVLRWLGIKPGDEVIIPAYTYSATALAVIHAGGVPVMVDTGSDFNISVSAIEKAITSKTKAIIPVDFSGFPCDYHSIYEVIERKQSMFVAESPVQQKFNRIALLSDAAHSLGATYYGKHTGCNADVVIFSLHAVKNVTTAEGGAICLNLPLPFDNHEIYATLRTMSLNCQTKDAFSKSQAGGWRYDIVDLGMKINMADVNAAIGLAQMREYDSMSRRRQEIFERYNHAFSQYKWAILPPYKSDNKVSSCHIYALRIDGFNELLRDALIDAISQLEVSVNVHFIPMPMLTFFKGLSYDIANYPTAYRNYSCEISLPIYPQLSNEEVDYVIESVVTCYNKLIDNEKGI